MSQQINLFNSIFRKKGFSFTSAAAMLYGSGMTILIAALIAAYQGNQINSVEREAQALANAQGEAAANVAKLTTELQKHKPNSALEAEIAGLDAQLQGREEIIVTLRSGAVGNTDGFSDYMRAFSRQNLSGLWLTGFDITGNELAIQGRTINADLVASYLKLLNQEKSLQGRQFAALRISQPQLEAVAPGTADPASNTDKRALVQNEPKGKQEAPTYLEFTVSTIDIPEGAPVVSKSSSGAGPLLGTISASAVLDSLKSAVVQQAPR